MTKRPQTKIVIADDEAELEARTTAATARPPVQIDIEDYSAGGKLELQGDAPPEGGLSPAPAAAAAALPSPSEDPIERLNERRAAIHAQQRNPFPPGSAIRYESRIRIVEAWQYNGKLAEAPQYVDRSWAAWGEYDEERKLEPGPALRVPIPNSPTGDKLCRKGDYVVRQEVTLALGVEPDVQLEVWPKDEFERFFLPKRTDPEKAGQVEVEAP